MTTTATNSGKSYLGVDNRAVVTNIDTLFARLNAFSSSVGSLTWADVLDNGAQASQDLDLNGHIATGANRIEADSLEASRAEFTDSLLVRGDADFDGNLLVGEWVRTRALLSDSSLTVARNIELGGGVGTQWSTLAIGPGAQASSFGSKALGSGSSASSVDALAIGRSATANQWAAVALGPNATASGVSSFASGEGASASNWAATAMGAGSTATSSGAFASGGGADATKWASIAMGHNATASGDFSIALGWNSTASSSGSMAFGEGSTASGWHALATGSQSSASSTHAVALGRSTTATGNHSMALGDDANATGDHSRAFGTASTASGTHSHAFGNNSTASGGNSYALGHYTQASGWSSIALGEKSVASGAHALALGDSTVASGYNSAALGSFSRATGHSSIAAAEKSEARSFHEVQFGTFVDVASLGTANPSLMVPEEALFVIGNGTSTSARSNALVIRKDGTATFSDSLSVLGNATFANELSVGDTLRAAAPALFADSVHMDGNLSIDGDVHLAGDLYASGVPVDFSSVRPTALLLGTATPTTLLAGDPPSDIPILFADEVDNAGMLSVVGGNVVVAVAGVYEIQTFVMARFMGPGNDGALVSWVEVNGIIQNPSYVITSYADFAPGYEATLRSTFRIRLAAGDTLSFSVEEGSGNGDSILDQGTFNVERVD